MLAALSAADHGLFERMMDMTFSPPAGSGAADHDTPGGATTNTNGRADLLLRSQVLMMGQAVRKKTVDTVQACRDMLLREPPERMNDFWGTVGLTSLTLTRPISARPPPVPPSFQPHPSPPGRQTNPFLSPPPPRSHRDPELWAILLLCVA